MLRIYQNLADKDSCPWGNSVLGVGGERQGQTEQRSTEGSKAMKQEKDRLRGWEGEGNHSGCVSQQTSLRRWHLSKGCRVRGQPGGDLGLGHIPKQGGLWRIFFFFFRLFDISWAAPAASGGSQARGLIRAIAASLCYSHSDARSKPRLQPTPQLTAT